MAPPAPANKTEPEVSPERVNPAKVGLATVAMVALVVPVIEILVPAVKSEVILDQLGAPAPPEIRT